MLLFAVGGTVWTLNSCMEFIMQVHRIVSLEINPVSGPWKVAMEMAALDAPLPV